MFGMKKRNDYYLRIMSVVMFIVMVVVNALANILPINGNTTAQVSNSYPNLFAPAGFTFSIWGIIYILLGVFCLYQFGIFRDKKSRLGEKTVNEIVPYFIISSVINALWIFAWQYRVIWLSVVLIVALLVCLIKINQILHAKQYNIKDFVSVKLPFSIYFGWITVATIANITTFLVSAGWNGFGLRPGIWMVFILLVGAIISIVTMVRNFDWVYGATIVWAYAGILYKHLSGTGFNGAYPSTISTLNILLAVLIVVVIYIFIKKPLGEKNIHF